MTTETTEPVEITYRVTVSVDDREPTEKTYKILKAATRYYFRSIALADVGGGKPSRRGIIKIEERSSDRIGGETIGQNVWNANYGEWQTAVCLP